MASSLSGCHSAPRHYDLVQKRLKASYENGDLTRDEYEEARDRYRNASKGESNPEDEPETGF
jgi:hypothetical protein